MGDHGAPYRLRRGDPAPVQHSGTTCGSASLTVARMLADPRFADWVRTGERRGAAFLPELGSEDARFAEAEQLTLRRTTRPLGPGGRLQPPWPRALGTPPWGARRELEHGASRPGTPYAVVGCRVGRGRRRALLARLGERLAADRPALLYVGSRSLPRHVTLLLPGAGGGPDLYDPAAGTVTALDTAGFVAGRLAVAGWSRPWCVVLPAP
ncbi:hypothetical protein [Lapillicoccus jejuensis]|uniref:Peptidase C39-like protein n=1 Tax=Lapillicoccus jejuensis TaxID=402171 RepID=A0A542DVH5_9MICO|nr:hypothetical protein [Lapillicoccus jejuensis]TQJ07092.1 hypothetical protein FB458_0139 [Lapillicoccus jejuensis]